MKDLSQKGGKKQQEKKQEHLSNPFPNTFFVQNIFFGTTNKWLAAI